MSSDFPEFTAPLMPCNLPVHRSPVAREQASKRILIMRLGAFGDILMGTPMLAALREGYPDAHITWIAERGQQQAIDANPFVDEVLLWTTRYWKHMVRHLQYPLWAVRALALRAELRRRKYDLFISFQPEEWPLLLRGVDPSISVGVFDTFRRFYGAKDTSRNTKLYSYAYSHPNLPDHRVDQYLLTLDALDLPKPASKRMYLGYTEEDRRYAERFLIEHQLLDMPGQRAPFVVLVPLTTWPTKCWPSERYVELGDALQQRGFRIILTGSAKEQEAVEGIAARMAERPAIAAGMMTFRQTAALMDRAALVVSGDTGPMHAAAALEKPYVALFGSTSPRWYGPLMGHGKMLFHPVPCGPCDQKRCPNQGDDFERCMRLLTVEEVLEASLSLLSRERLAA
jgi:ADP-heptose:LPS heptosyltransferase